MVGLYGTYNSYSYHACAFVICLIYVATCTLSPWASGVHVRQTTHAHGSYNCIQLHKQ